jgi:hypothetical protein
MKPIKPVADQAFDFSQQQGPLTVAPQALPPPPLTMKPAKKGGLLGALASIKKTLPFKGAPGAKK